MNPKGWDYGLILLASIFSTGSIVLLVMMRGTTVFVPFGWSETWVLAWDAGLSFLFFVQHSGMVRRSCRTRLGSVVSDRHVGAVYAIASGIALGLVSLLWQRSAISVLVVEALPRFLMRAAGFIAFATLVISFIALRSFDMLGIGPIRAHLRGQEHRAGAFTIRGPYRWVRHPLYACLIVIFWSNPDLTADRLLFNILWTGWIVVATHLEERDLVREFGDAYIRYQHQVPMLFPKHRPAQQV